MTRERALEISSFLVGKTHRMSGKDANDFFQIYKHEINTSARVQPCGCNPSEWQRMLSETYSVIDSVLATETVSLIAQEVPGDPQTPMIDNTITQSTEVDQVTQEKPKSKRKIIK